MTAARSNTGQFIPEDLLRRCLRELTALSTLSAVWSRSQPQAIGEALALVLSRALTVDFVYVRAGEQAGAVEVARNSNGALCASQVKAIGEMLAPHLLAGALDQPTIPNPVGSGRLKLAIVPIGLEGGYGSVVAGSGQPGFPGQTDRLLLEMAANQAAIVLQHRWAEQALREREENLRHLVEGVLDYAIVTLDVDGRVLGWNAGAERLKGYRTEEIVGQCHSRFFPAQAVAAGVPVRALRIAAAEGRWVYEGWRVRKDGSRFWADAVITAIRDGNGALRGFTTITRDLTERRQAADALQRSEARKTAMFQTALDCIISIDHDGKILEFNTAAERTFGYRAADVLGREMADLIVPPPLCDRQRGGLARHLAAGDGSILDRRVEMTAVRADGTEFPVEVAVTRIPIDGPPVFTAYMRDITDRKHYERELRNADRRKDEFLAILSHELRNPLAPIWNALQVLRKKGPDEPEARWGRDVIERQVRHLTRLIDDLLDVSRITCNKLDLCKQRVDLAGVIKVAVESTRPAIEQAGHELIVTLPSEPVLLDADLVRLTQVFQNLINNAVKYTARGGRIWLEAVRERAEVVAWVKDTGVGISADKLPHLFEMFFQVDRSLERTQGGLGIGLALVRRLVELHGGTVAAHSDGPGKGSQFTIRLPVVEEPSQPQLTPADAEENQAVTRRILVADDNRDSADTLATVLALAGNEVHTAYDGLQAVEAAERLRPDVVLLDVGMPRLNGHDACRRIRGSAWGRNMVVIALTGWSQESDRRETLAAGFDVHMVKPVDHAALARLLQSLPTHGS